MRTRIKELKNMVPGRPSFVGAEVTIKRWVRTVRNQKTFAFIEINDGSTLSNFQVLVNADYPKFDRLISSFSTVSCSAPKALLLKALGKNQELELQATDITIIGESTRKCIRCKKNGIHSSSSNDSTPATAH